jgi:L-seryl-tRNA(Ser) seleniumtransferase
MKVNKEELLGMLAAVERYVTIDHDAEARDFEQRAETIRASVAGLAGVKAEIFVPEVANHVPHVRITWDAMTRTLKPADVVTAMRDGEPSIGTRADGDAIVVGVWMMRPGEDRVVARRLRQVLGA